MQQFKGLMYYYELEDKEYNKRFLIKSIILLVFILSLLLLTCYFN